MAAIFSLRTARLAGCLLGVALATAVVLESRPASGGQAVGADVSFYANQTGELATSPPGPARFLTRSVFRPGESAAGRFRVTNQTGTPESLHLAAMPSAHSLDRLLDVKLSSGGRTLAAGELGSLSRPSRGVLTLAPGESATVSVAASIPSTAEDRIAAALVDVSINFSLGGAS